MSLLIPHDPSTIEEGSRDCDVGIGGTDVGGVVVDVLDLLRTTLDIIESHGSYSIPRSSREYDAVAAVVVGVVVHVRHQ